MDNSIICEVYQHFLLTEYWSPFHTGVLVDVEGLDGGYQATEEILAGEFTPPLPHLYDHTIGILNHIKTKDEVRNSGPIYTALNGSDFCCHWQKTNVKRNYEQKSCMIQ